MELEVTWSRSVRVWWAYMWRSVIATLILTFVAAFVLTLVMRSLGLTQASAQYASSFLGLVIGFGMSVVPMKLILGMRFGEFRVALVSDD